MLLHISQLGFVLVMEKRRVEIREKKNWRLSHGLGQKVALFSLSISFKILLLLIPCSTALSLTKHNKVRSSSSSLQEKSEAYGNTCTCVWC